MRAQKRPAFLNCYHMLSLKNFVCIALLLFVIASCKQKFTRYDAGLHYRIVHIGDGEKVKQGQTLKLQMTQSYNDSTLLSTGDSMPYYQPHDSTQLSKAAFVIFSQVTKGDSLIFRALTDSVFKDKLPPFAKKGEWLETRVWVQEIFSEHDDWRSDYERERQRRSSSRNDD